MRNIVYINMAYYLLGLSLIIEAAEDLRLIICSMHAGILKSPADFTYYHLFSNNILTRRITSTPYSNPGGVS